MGTNRALAAVELRVERVVQLPVPEAPVIELN